jgi:hypothetical protein
LFNEIIESVAARDHIDSQLPDFFFDLHLSPKSLDFRRVISREVRATKNRFKESVAARQIFIHLCLRQSARRERAKDVQNKRAEQN